MQKYGVQVYFSGHVRTTLHLHRAFSDSQQDHSLQHLQQDNSEFPHYLVSGGGGYRAHGKVGYTGCLND